MSIISATPNVAFAGAEVTGRQWRPAVRIIESGGVVKNLHLKDASGEPMFCATQEEAQALCEMEVMWLMNR